MKKLLLILYLIAPNILLYGMQLPLLTQEDWNTLSPEAKKIVVTEIVTELRHKIIIHNAHNNKFVTTHLENNDHWKQITNYKGRAYAVPTCIQNLQLFNGHEKSTIFPVDCPFYQVSPDQNYTAVIQKDTVTIYDDSATHKSLRNSSSFTLPVKKRATTLCFSPQSTYLFTGEKKCIHLWNLSTNTLMNTLSGHSGPVTAIECNNEGDKMLSISYSDKKNHVILWDITNLKTIRQIKKNIFANTARMSHIFFSPHDERAILTAKDGSITLLDGVTGDCIASHPCVTDPRRSSLIETYPTFSPDNHFFATGTYMDDDVCHTQLWDSYTGECIAQLTPTIKCTGVAFTPTTQAVISVLESNQTMITHLFNRQIARALFYLHYHATIPESYALYCAYWAYKNNSSFICDAPSALYRFENNFINKLIKKYFLIKNNNTLQVQLDDGSLHLLKPHEVESSASILAKKLLRQKTKMHHIHAWYPTLSSNKIVRYHYKQLQNSPIYLKNISQSLFALFRKIISLGAKAFSTYFRSLSMEEQNGVLFIASEKGLSIGSVMTQLTSLFIIPEIINKHISPHLLIKNIRGTMRDNIIIHNARAHTFTQKETSLPPDELTIDNNRIYTTVVRTNMPKKKKYLFDGYMYPIHISFDNQTWTHRSESITDHTGMSYLVTNSISNEEYEQKKDEEFPKDSFLLWTINNDTFVNKKYMQPGGDIIKIVFSPHGHLFATSTKANERYSHNNLIITLLNTDHGGTTEDILLPEDGVIKEMCFNPQSTILATGEYNNNTSRSIIKLWDICQGACMSSATIYNSAINNMLFNIDSTKLITISSGHNNKGKIIIWNTTNPYEVEIIIVHKVHDAIHKCMVSPDNSIIVASLSRGALLLLNGLTGALKKRQNKYLWEGYPQVASVFNSTNRLLVSAVLSTENDPEGNTLLWDPQRGVVLSALVKAKHGVIGVGFSPNKQEIITTLRSCETDEFSFVTTTLFNQDMYNMLVWIKKSSSLFQQYALYCMHSAREHDIFSCAYTRRLLSQAFNTKNETENNVKLLVKKYL